MQPPKISVGPALWLASWCLLAAGHPPAQEEPWQPCSQQLGSVNCPHPTRSATLVPSFTKTSRPTAHPQKHTTTHHHHHHHHTTMPPTSRTVTSHHPTTPTHHPTTTHEKHTTTHRHHATTTAPANRTSHATPPSNQTVSPYHPTNHTTRALPTTHHHTAAPQPTERPVVLVGNYIVKEGSTVCLRAEMGLQLQVRYAGKAKQELWGAFPVQPNRTHFSGMCSDKMATLKLHFPEGFILFVFKKNETEKAAFLSQVQANLTYQFPQATENFFSADNASLREFVAPLGKSYQCRNRSVALSGSFRLNALQERVQAFQLQGEEFGEAEVCPEQQSRSIIVPIVVGVVLCLLILIVLVAFAVGRWRAHTGYQSL